MKEEALKVARVALVEVSSFGSQVNRCFKWNNNSAVFVLLCCFEMQLWILEARAAKLTPVWGCENFKLGHLRQFVFQAEFKEAYCFAASMNHNLARNLANLSWGYLRRSIFFLNKIKLLIGFKWSAKQANSAATEFGHWYFRLQKQQSCFSAALLIRQRNRIKLTHFRNDVSVTNFNFVIPNLSSSDFWVLKLSWVTLALVSTTLLLRAHSWSIKQLPGSSFNHYT